MRKTLPHVAGISAAPRVATVLLAVCAFTLTGCDTRSVADHGVAPPAVSETPADAVAWPDPADTVTRTAEQWKEKLTPAQFNILREAGTERPYTHPYNDNHADGTYACAACGNRLFDSATKFDSGTGWPSFYQPVAPRNILEKPDGTGPWQRTEVLCARCRSHLGHVFNDAPQQPTGLRYCMNGTALLFHPSKADAKAGE